MSATGSVVVLLLCLLLVIVPVTGSGFVIVPATGNVVKASINSGTSLFGANSPHQRITDSSLLKKISTPQLR